MEQWEQGAGEGDVRVIWNIEKQTMGMEQQEQGAGEGDDM